MERVYNINKRPTRCRFMQTMRSNPKYLSIFRKHKQNSNNYKIKMYMLVDE